MLFRSLIGEADLGADQQAEGGWGNPTPRAALLRRPPLAVCLRRQMGPHRPGEGTLVGDGQRPVAQFPRPGDHFLRLGGAAQETEAGQAVEFGVGGEHGAAIYYICYQYIDFAPTFPEVFEVQASPEKTMTSPTTIQFSTLTY